MIARVLGHRVIRAAVGAIELAAELAAIQPPAAPSPPPARRYTTTRSSALDGKLRVPAGFVVTYFAKGLDGVRFMALAPDGAVYASQPGKGRVVRLPDANHDGVADSVVVVVTGSRSRTGSPSTRARSTSRTPTAWCASRSARTARDGRVPCTSTTFRAAAGTGRARSSSAPTARCTSSVGSSCNLCVEQSTDRARGAALRRGRIGQARVRFRAAQRRRPRGGSGDERALGVAERARQPDAGPSEPAAGGDQHPHRWRRLRLAVLLRRSRAEPGVQRRRALCANHPARGDCRRTPRRWA